MGHNWLLQITMGGETLSMLPHRRSEEQIYIRKRFFVNSTLNCDFLSDKNHLSTFTTGERGRGGTPPRQSSHHISSSSHFVT